MLKSYAVFGDNPPPIVVESCTFVNFPSQSAYQSAAIGLRSTDANGAITSTPPVMVSRTLFDASFTNAWPLARFENAGDFPVTMTDCIIPSAPVFPDFMPDVTNNMHIVTSQVAWAGFPLADSPAATLGIGAFAPIPSDSLDDTDHDTLLDYNEVYERGTDPFLVDSDNDGILDDVEIFVDHTDPSNPYSFKQNLTVTVTNKASAAYAVYTAWGISNVGWEANGLVAFPEGFGTTNYVDASSQGATHVKAFCDLNGNGTFDADYDILRVRSIPPGICVWNSSAQHNERAGALISPRHLLMANHWYPTSTNEVLYFRGKSGCVYSRKPIRWRGVSVPNSVSSYPDTGVVLLNEPLDTNDVSVISIFSTTLLSKVGSGYAVPFIYFNRRKEALVKEIKSLTSGAVDPNWHHISFMRPLVTVRQSFITDVWGIPGDSSSPSFVLIDNKLVVFGMHSRTTSDSPIFLFTQHIQQAMDILAPGYELIIEDLSAFPDVQ